MAVGGDARWVLVTGGTDGIGRSIAHTLAARGLGIIVVGSHSDKGETAKRALRMACRNDRVHEVGGALHVDQAPEGDAKPLIPRMADACGS